MAEPPKLLGCAFYRACRDAPGQKRVRGRRALRLGSIRAFCCLGRSRCPLEQPRSALRLRRVLLGVERTTSGATALYRSDVYTGDTPLPHFPWWNDVRELRLVKTPQGWRVQDVNLGVTGDGHLLLSGAQMALLRGGAWLGSWRSDKGGEGGGGNRLK